MLAFYITARSAASIGDGEPNAPASYRLEMMVQNGAGPFSETELTIMERYKRAAVEDMDGPEILNVLEEIEDEIRRRTALEGATDRE